MLSEEEIKLLNDLSNKLKSDGKLEGQDLDSYNALIQKLMPEPNPDEPPVDEPPSDEPPADEPPADEPPEDTPMPDENMLLIIKALSSIKSDLAIIKRKLSIDDVTPFDGDVSNEYEAMLKKYMIQGE